MIWETAQSGERDWWGTCQNTYGEQEKQLTYAHRMGLRFYHDGRSPYNIDMHGAMVLDIGGGPSSLLLKCVNVEGVVADPCEYPAWVAARYECAGITYMQVAGERLGRSTFDEAWIYNVLQHTDNPELVIRNARGAAKIVRLFEWIDTTTNTEHPHSLREAHLNDWLGGTGKTETLNMRALRGRCYYGVFKGDNY